MDIALAEKIIPPMIGLTIFGIPFGYLIHLLVRAIASRSWPTTTGVITRSAVKPSKYHRNQASPDIRYEYEVSGERYSSSVVCIGDFLNCNWGDAKEIKDRYPVGARVRVHYHPKNPLSSTLEARASGFLFMWIIIALGAMGSIIYGILTE